MASSKFLSCLAKGESRVLQADVMMFGRSFICWRDADGRDRWFGLNREPRQKWIFRDIYEVKLRILQHQHRGVQPPYFTYHLQHITYRVSVRCLHIFKFSYFVCKTGIAVACTVGVYEIFQAKLLAQCLAYGKYSIDVSFSIDQFSYQFKSIHFGVW